MATERQKKAVQKIVENGGIVSRAMEEAGYSPATAKTPQKLTESEGYKEVTEPIVRQMKKERDRVIKAMTVKQLDATSYRDLMDAVDKLTKNIQLLSGEDTEKNSVTVRWSYGDSHPVQPPKLGQEAPRESEAVDSSSTPPPSWEDGSKFEPSPT